MVRLHGSGVTVRGMREVQAKFKRATEEVKEAMLQGVEDATADLLRRAKEEAPIGETGDLRGSGSKSVKVVAGEVIGEVGFNTPYALIQHEDMTFNHPQGGKAKYLTDPLNRNATKYRKMILEEGRRATR